MSDTSLPPVIHDGAIGGVAPMTLEPHEPVALTDPAELAGIVAAAREAQPAWQALGFEARAKIMLRAARALLEDWETCVELVQLEAGKTRGHALMNEAIGPLDYLKGWIKTARPELKRHRLPINMIAMPGKKAYTDLIPRGVVGVIAPWNYPLGVYFKPCLPALLTGNSIVIKPSEYAPRTGAWFAATLQKFLPAGVITVVQGGPEVGRAMIDGGIDACVFTGSVGGGRAVLKHTAERMIPCSVELGGKDPAIVLADCDMDRTVAGVLNVGLQNGGQDCGSIERVYVEESIADEFVEKLGKAAARLKVPHPGDALDDAAYGPLVTPPQLALVEAHVADAIDKGARVVTGGKRSGQGLWHETTVLDNCSADMRCIAEESFGPIFPIVRVKDADEAVRLANESEFGLNASVWTRDLKRGEALGRQLHCGSVFVNNHGLTGAMPFAPWTGVKDSGFGVANSRHALSTFVRPKTTLIDTSSGPDPWWLPADKLMEEVGERLVAAQLGKLAQALKLPGLMGARKKKIMAFVRGEKLLGD
jgi:acyl-CoA reductase-like NAD-dependent aldehyde dehydrogenase